MVSLASLTPLTEQIDFEPQRVQERGALYSFISSGTTPTSNDLNQSDFLLQEDCVTMPEDPSADEAAVTLNTTLLPLHVQAQVNPQFNLATAQSEGGLHLDPFLVTSLDCCAVTSINHQDNEGRTKLHYAVLAGSVSDVEHLLIVGASHAIVDSTGSQALHYAANEGNPNIIKLLLGSGADVRSEDPFGRSPLHLSSNRSTTAILLEACPVGTMVSAPDDFGDTPLHWALNALKSSGWDCAYDEVIESLLDASASVNKPNHEGVTPFHCILDILPHERRTLPLQKYSRLATLMFRFLELGANVLEAKPYGKLPFYSLLNTSKYYLQPALGYIESLPRWSSHHQSIYRIIQTFLNRGADPHTKVAGKTLLHYLIQNMFLGPSSDTRLLSIICERINLNRFDVLGCFPLHEVLQRPMCSGSSTGLAVINLLLSYGANADLVNSDGMPPLSFLLKNNVQGTRVMDFVETLLGGGASSFPLDLGDSLPIYLAARNFGSYVRESLISILLDRYDGRDWWSEQGKPPLLIANQGSLSWPQLWTLAYKSVGLKEDSGWSTLQEHIDRIAESLPQDVQGIICKMAKELLAAIYLQQIIKQFYEIYQPGEIFYTPMQEAILTSLCLSFHEVISKFSPCDLNQMGNRLGRLTGREFQQILLDANSIVAHSINNVGDIEFRH